MGVANQNVAPVAHYIDPRPDILIWDVMALVDVDGALILYPVSGMPVLRTFIVIRDLGDPRRAELDQLVRIERSDRQELHRVPGVPPRRIERQKSC
jgi:hypothetical protein